jgi:hypothetical protein
MWPPIASQILQHAGCGKKGGLRILDHSHEMLSATQVTVGRFLAQRQAGENGKSAAKVLERSNGLEYMTGQLGEVAIGQTRLLLPSGFRLAPSSKVSWE